MKAEDLEVAARGDEDVLELAAQGDLQRRQPPGDRQARAGHERDVQARGRSTICWASARLYDRCLSMKTGTGAARGADDVEHLAEVTPAGVELLELGVERVIAVLGDQQHGVDGELAGAQGQRIGDRRAQPHAMLPCLGPAQVGGLGRLLDVQAGDLEGGLVRSPRKAVASSRPDRQGNRRRTGRRYDRRARGRNRYSPGQPPWAAGLAGPRQRPSLPTPCPRPFRPRWSRETGDGWEDGSWSKLHEWFGKAACNKPEAPGSLLFDGRGERSGHDNANGQPGPSKRPVGRFFRCGIASRRGEIG